MTQIPFITVGGRSTYAVNMQPKLIDACDELRIGHRILAAVAYDHNVTTFNGIGSLQPLEFAGYLGDHDRATQGRQRRSPLEARLVNLQVEAARQVHLPSTLDIWFYGQTGGHKYVNQEALETLDERQHSIRIGVTNISHETYLRDALRQDPTFPVTLKDLGLLEITIETDNRSSIASQLGRPFQDRLLTKGIGSLLAGNLHFRNQRGAADAAHALGRYAARVGVAYGLRYFLADPQLWWLKPLPKLLRFPKRGSGHFDDLCQQTWEAAQDALSKPNWRTIDEDISREKQAFLTLAAPLRLDDERWGQLVAEVEHPLAQQFPFVTVIWASGNGTPHPYFADRSPYHVQASLFFPMPDIPRPIQQIVEAPSFLRPRATQETDSKELAA